MDFIKPHSTSECAGKKFSEDRDLTEEEVGARNNFAGAFSVLAAVLETGADDAVVETVLKAVRTVSHCVVKEQPNLLNISERCFQLFMGAISREDRKRIQAIIARDLGKDDDEGLKSEEPRRDDGPDWAFPEGN